MAMTLVMHDRSTLRRLGVWLLLVWSVAHVCAVQPLPYQDPARPIEARVEDLLARMTLAEKVGQMTQVNLSRLMGLGEWDRGPLNERWLDTMFARLQVGSVLSGGGAAPLPNTPRAWAETTNALQRYALEHSRLGIPIIYGVDAVHGHNNVLGATIYPHNVGLAATFDPALVQAVAERTAADVRATGIHWNFAPVADLARDLRWGRFYETFGEEPWLVAEMVAASVRGFQASGAVAATVKHFVAYGAAEDGRDRGPAWVAEDELWDLHLPPFEAGLAAGASTVMANSGSLNGVPVHASAELLTGLLRERLGFDGVIVSDWNDIERLQSVHRFAVSFDEAVALGINAGIDVYMVPHDAARFIGTLLDLVERGVVPEARIDDAVRRVLTLKMRLGLFEAPFVDATAAAASLAGDHALAFEAASRSLTLLENDGVLPLTVGTHVLVTGPSATSVANQMGGWTIGWQGVDDATELPPAVTVLDGLRRRAPDDTIVSHADHRDLAAVREAARQADVVIAVVGEPPYAEGHGDTTTATLDEAQRDLLDALLASGTPTVAVLLAGRPIILSPRVHDGVSGLIMAYLPGTEAGSALAEALFGGADFSGRLPFSWPMRAAPITSGAAAAGDAVALRYPFGHGLSYTRFDVANLVASRSGDALQLAFDVANLGAVAGRETVHVYGESAHDADGAQPRRLLGFAQVVLQPGTVQRLTLRVPMARLASGSHRALPSGDYDLHAGTQRVRLYLP